MITKPQLPTITELAQAYFETPTESTLQELSAAIESEGYSDLDEKIELLRPFYWPSDRSGLSD